MVPFQSNQDIALAQLCQVGSLLDLFEIEFLLLVFNVIVEHQSITYLIDQIVPLVLPQDSIGLFYLIPSPLVLLQSHNRVLGLAKVVLVLLKPLQILDHDMVTILSLILLFRQQ